MKNQHDFFHPYLDEDLFQFRVLSLSISEPVGSHTDLSFFLCKECRVSECCCRLLTTKHKLTELKAFFINSRCEVVLSKCQGLFDSSDISDTISMLNKFSGFFIKCLGEIFACWTDTLITFFIFFGGVWFPESEWWQFDRYSEISVEDMGMFEMGA